MKNLKPKDRKVLNRAEYIMRMPKERRKFKKMLLKCQKDLQKEWHLLSDPESNLSQDDRDLMVALAEFTKKTLDTIDFLDNKTE